MRNLFLTGKALLSRKQGSILSAAFLIMGLSVASSVLGLVRQRILAHYFTAEEIEIYLAAFYPFETLFAILVSGSLATAFVPIFTSLFTKGEKQKAWFVAGVTQTNILVMFLLLSVGVFIFAKPIATLLVPGFSADNQETMVSLARFLALAQVFFTLSFFLVNIQQSLGRFLVPALAPIFYNIGIISGAVGLSFMGLWGPAIGAVIGAFMHFALQIPFVKALGFKFIPRINFKDADFRQIIKLATPRFIEITTVRIAKGFELSLSTLVSTGAYTYLSFANTLQVVPTSLFGAAFASASFPTLSTHAARHDKESFIRTFVFAVKQILFFVIPLAATLAVLRIPLVRIAFGTDKFTWDDTLQTGYALSAFALGIAGQSILEVLKRSFYALQDTKTPVVVALFSVGVNIGLAFFLTRFLGLGVWSIALAFSIATLLQVGILLTLLHKQMRIITSAFVVGVGKIISAAACSGVVMFFMLRIPDQAVWDKRLSFVGSLGLALPTRFRDFVLDTRYTIDLIFLVIFVITLGAFVYLAVSILLRVSEVEILSRLVGNLLTRKVTINHGEIVEAEVSVTLPSGE